MQSNLNRGRSVDRAGVVVAGLLFLLAAVIGYEAISITRQVTYGVGPTAALKIVGIGLVLLGAATLLNALRGVNVVDPEPLDARPVWIIMAACLAMILFIRVGVGFIPAMTVLFAATATAFGRRRIVSDLLIGAVVALLIYLLFSKLLTLTLPQGPLERLIG